MNQTINTDLYQSLPLRSAKRTAFVQCLCWWMSQVQQRFLRGRHAILEATQMGYMSLKKR